MKQLYTTDCMKLPEITLVQVIFTYGKKGKENGSSARDNRPWRKNPSYYNGTWFKPVK